MSKAKYLPGPWAQTRTKYLVKFSASSHSEGIWHFFAKVCVRIKGEGKDDETGLANARLIAAAPELLEALQGIEKALSEQESVPGYWRIKAKEAIAKATGETENEK